MQEVDLITGTDFEVLVDFVDGDGLAIDFTGATLRAQLRRAVGNDSSGALLGAEMTVGNGGLALTATAGEIKLKLSKTVTATFATGYARLCVFCLWADGDEEEILRASVNIRQGGVR